MFSSKNRISMNQSNEKKIQINVRKTSIGGQMETFWNEVGGNLMNMEFE